MTASAVAGTLVLVWPTITRARSAVRRRRRQHRARGGRGCVALEHERRAPAVARRGDRASWRYVFGIALLASPGSSLHAVIVLLGIYLVVLGGLRVLHAAEAWRQNRSAWS